jgi:hypothetical protein
MSDMMTCGLLASSTFASMPFIPSEGVPLCIIVRDSVASRPIWRTVLKVFVP